MTTLTTDTTWSLGTLIWLPLSILFVAACIVIGLWLWRKIDGADSIDAPFLKGLSILSFVVAGALILGTVAGMYPYQAEYHQWHNVSGSVEKIDNRLIGTGDGMETKFVVRFTGDGQQYGCDDTRCASVRKGDDLTLSCKRAWQYTGVDGYDCRFVSTEAAS